MDTQVPKIYLIGNPNSGKTSLFNALTGLNHKVANYPGVTVESKSALIKLQEDRSANLVDLPGTYSLYNSASIDEQLVLKTLTEQPPELVLVLADSNNLARNLFLATQVIELGLNAILVLTMRDQAEDSGIKIHTKLLERELSVSVVSISVKKQIGINSLLEKISIKLAQDIQNRPQLVFPDKQLAPAERYARISEVISKSVDDSELNESKFLKLCDKFLLHNYWGFLILALVFGSVFQAIFVLAEPPMQLIEIAVNQISLVLFGILPEGVFTSLLVDGVVSGVGNVLVFLPQIAILFFFLSVLEDCGYLARGSFLLDSLMRKFGLQGRAFIPLLSSFACAIPGIMATRSIPSRADRITTIMVAPLMSCSARLPVYTLLIAAFIPQTFIFGVFSLKGLVLLSLYLLGIFGALLVAKIIRRKILVSEPSLYVMEVPPLRRPSLRSVLRSVYGAVVSFLKSAGTIILACSVIIWFLSSYPKGLVENSYAGQFGKFIEPAIKPLGFNWQIGFAIFASLPAREVFITGLSTVYNLAEDTEDNLSLIKIIQEKRDTGEFSLATGLSLLVFYVFACQCMSTLAVCRKETGSWLWTAAMFGYMTALAYLAAYLTYTISSAFL